MLYTSWDIAKILVALFGDEPCNFNDMDDLTDEWCSENCGRVTVTECWEHAIVKRWYEVKEK